MQPPGQFQGRGAPPPGRSSYKGPRTERFGGRRMSTQLHGKEGFLVLLRKSALVFTWDNSGLLPLLFV